MFAPGVVVDDGDGSMGSGELVVVVKKVLEAAGSSLDDVVKVTVFLRNVNEFAKMNEVYESYFFKDQPARSTAVTNLAIPNMLIEMECIAYCRPS